MPTDSNKPKLIEGGVAVDDRGRVSFANDFGFDGIKRFYMIENFSTGTIRAWHGHRREAKYVLVVSGAALVAAVVLDNLKKPNKKNFVSRFVLSEFKPSLIYIPPGYANGFKALAANTKIIFFSTATVEGSKDDDYRFPYDYWGKRVWEVENR
jgi:dTDP-4-dehydrorhamnose 3,5-epimerase